MQSAQFCINELLFFTLSFFNLSEWHRHITFPIVGNDNHSEHFGTMLTLIIKVSWQAGNNSRI